MLGSLLIGGLFTLVVSLIVGLLVALPVLLPPLRRPGREHVRVRRTEIGVCGLLAFLLMFVAWTYLRAELAGIWIGFGSDYNGSEIANNSVFYIEMRLRSALPPSTERICYTQDASVCRAADYYLAHTDSAQWAWYGASLFVSAISGLFGGLWARRFSRPAAVGTA